MKQKRNYHWLKSPKTSSEKRANQGKNRNRYVRAKRRVKNLPDMWDDRPCTYQRTWKVKRNKQYYCDGRGQKHTIECDDRYEAWWLRRRCEEKGIPCTVDIVRKKELRTRPVYIKWPIKTIILYRYVKRNGINTSIPYGYLPQFEYIKTDRTETYTKVVSEKAYLVYWR